MANRKQKKQVGVGRKVVFILSRLPAVILGVFRHHSIPVCVACLVYLLSPPQSLTLISFFRFLSPFPVSSTPSSALVARVLPKSYIIWTTSYGSIVPHNVGSGSASWVTFQHSIERRYCGLVRLHGLPARRTFRSSRWRGTSCNPLGWTINVFVVIRIDRSFL